MTSPSESPQKKEQRVPIASDIFDDEDENIDEIIEVDPDESQYHPIVDGMDEDQPNDEQQDEESYDDNDFTELQNEFYEGNKMSFGDTNGPNRNTGSNGYVNYNRFQFRPNNEHRQSIQESRDVKNMQKPPLLAGKEESSEMTKNIVKSQENVPVMDKIHN